MASFKKDIKVEFIVGIDSIENVSEYLHISGLLSIPRVSLNGWIYLPEELAKQDGKTVPMFFEHEELFDPDAEPIGVLHTIWDESLMQLNYDAIIFDKEKAKAIIEKRFKHVSMAATWEDYDVIRGWLVPKGVEIIEGSLVLEPGIPESSVSIIDYVSNDPVTNDKLIPTKLCDVNLYYTILADSHRTGQAYSLPVCDGKMVDNEINKTEKKTIMITDVNLIRKILDANNKVVVDSIRDMLDKPKPTAKIADDNNINNKDIFYRIVSDSLRRFYTINWHYVNEQLRVNNVSADAIGLTELGSGAGAQWLENITIVPAGLNAGLRNSCEVVVLDRGAKEAHFTLISTPTPVDGDAPNVPNDATQTITDIVATPVERVLKQRITDQAMRSTSANLAEVIANTFRNAEVLDEDRKVLSALDNIPVANLAADIYGGNALAENDIASTDIFTNDLLAKAKRALLRKGWEEARMPGSLVCVMSPEQMEQLMNDNNIQNFIEWVDNGDSVRNGSIPRLHGIDLVVSSEVPTGTGSGAPAVTTHRAFVYVKNVAVGLAFSKELQIESTRYPEERATTIVGSYELAAKVKREDAVVRIVTYGSG
ncbi:MAG: hypothetical protein KatS3mg003_0978 [Candidatus Nitrosocaldaceae archaeon]|nr:MAG: hypothetical protein KatS3mg003_0978 [Candidatus Nitrosocaldaceae archaeon]